MLKNIKITHIVIAVLLGIIIWLKACDSPNINNSNIISKDTTTTIDIKLDSIKKDTTYIPVPYEVLIPIEIPAKIDTQNILKNYFSTKIYKDTIYFSDSLKLIISDSLKENSIQNRNVFYKATQKTITVTNNITTIVKEDPKNKFYIGGTLGFNRQFFNMVTADLNYIPKSGRNIYGLGIGVDQNIQPMLKLSLGVKIGK
jgi:hypothetical protein